ncbi:alpha/beta hydrolase [Microbacterium sp. NPDC056052]|uniref:alpha/beta hydrolase n=1 Tax=Microbacterium sp. NPDC056052 TaxID=3345695 RepID=UPI0035E2E695
MTDRPRILLVHGAWVGAWEFADAVALLRERGWEVEALELPSTGSTAGLDADAAAVTAALDAMTRSVILVGHSYGGVPITQAGHHPAVQHLVYVAAFALGGALPELWHVDGGQVSLGPDRAARIAMVSADFPPGTPREAAEQLADLFRPQSLASLQDEVGSVAWRHKPATYILTEKDVLVPPPFQELLATRAGAEIVRVPTGHAPFQEDPAGFVAVIEAVAAALEP